MGKVHQSCHWDWSKRLEVGAGCVISFKVADAGLPEKEL